MELTAADKERIEQEWHKILFADNNDDVDQCAAKLAEYATIYEREQQVEKQKVTVERLCKVNERIQRLEAERSDLLAKVLEQEKEIQRLKETLAGALGGYTAKEVEQAKRIEEQDRNIEQLSLSHSHLHNRNAQLEELLYQCMQENTNQLSIELLNEIKSAITK